MVKVCESLGLAVKLESICAEVFLVSVTTIKCQYVGCFIQRTGIYQSLIMFVESCHVQKRIDLVKWVDVLIRLEKARKGYKTISKGFGLHKSTVRQIVYKWRKFKTTVTFPRNGRPVVDKVHRSSTWVKVQIRIVKYYSSKSKSTAFSILLEWKYKSTQFFMYLSKKYW